MFSILSVIMITFGVWVEINKISNLRIGYIILILITFFAIGVNVENLQQLKGEKSMHTINNNVWVKK